MKTDERNKFAIKSFLGEYLDLKKDKDNEMETVDSIRKLSLIHISSPRDCS